MVVALGYRPESWLTRTGLFLRDDATIIADAEGRTPALASWRRATSSMVRIAS